MKMFACFVLFCVVLNTMTTAKLIPIAYDLESNESKQTMQRSSELIEELLAIMMKNIVKQKSNPNPEQAKKLNDAYVLSYDVTDDIPEEKDRRMTVNNNFNGEHLGSNQLYLERGNPVPGGPPPNNIQLLSPRAST